MTALPRDPVAAVKLMVEQAQRAVAKTYPPGTPPPDTDCDPVEAWRRVYTRTFQHLANYYDRAELAHALDPDHRRSLVADCYDHGVHCPHQIDLHLRQHGIAVSEDVIKDDMARRRAVNSVRTQLDNAPCPPPHVFEPAQLTLDLQ